MGHSWAGVVMLAAAAERPQESPPWCCSTAGSSTTSTGPAATPSGRLATERPQRRSPCRPAVGVRPARADPCCTRSQDDVRRPLPDRLRRRAWVGRAMRRDGRRSGPSRTPEPGVDLADFTPGRRAADLPRHRPRGARRWSRCDAPPARTSADVLPRCCCLVDRARAGARSPTTRASGSAACPRPGPLGGTSGTPAGLGPRPGRGRAGPALGALISDWLTTGAGRAQPADRNVAR